MPEVIYRCDVCGKDRAREQLIVKRAQFREMGVGGKVFKTVTIGWLCATPDEDTGVSCLESDADFKRLPYRDAPGSVAKRTVET